MVYSKHSLSLSCRFESKGSCTGRSRSHKRSRWAGGFLPGVRQPTTNGYRDAGNKEEKESIGGELRDFLKILADSADMCRDEGYGRNYLVSYHFYSQYTLLPPSPLKKKLLRKSCLQRESIKNFYGKLGGGRKVYFGKYEISGFQPTISFHAISE